MQVAKGSKLEHKCELDYRSGRGSHDPDNLVADHGNRTRLGGKRYRSVIELHNFRHHFGTRTRFCTDRAPALVPEREAFTGITGPAWRKLKHPAASQSGVARKRGSRN